MHFNESHVVGVCEKEMMDPYESRVTFKRIYVHRCDGGWYIICSVSKPVRGIRSLDSYNRLKIKMIIIGEFFVNLFGEIIFCDYRHDEPPVDVFGDHSVEYSKSDKRDIKI